MIGKKSITDKRLPKRSLDYLRKQKQKITMSPTSTSASASIPYLTMSAPRELETTLEKSTTYVPKSYMATPSPTLDDGIRDMALAALTKDFLNVSLTDLTWFPFGIYLFNY
jgi:hypothetical protein